MKKKYLGDSYDFVKRTFIGWLANFGEWAVEPMFTEKVSTENADWFAEFLGATLVCPHLKTLTRETDRREFFEPARTISRHLFLDPDTGINKNKKKKRRPSHLDLEELVELALTRPKFLTLVYDQSVLRGDEENWLLEKSRRLQSHGVHSLYYVSHAPMLLATADPSSFEKAAKRLLEHLPKSRILLVEQAVRRQGPAGSPAGPSRFDQL